MKQSPQHWSKLSEDGRIKENLVPLTLQSNQSHFLAVLSGYSFVVLAETGRRYLILAANHQGDFNLIRHPRDLLDGRECFDFALKHWCTGLLEHVLTHLSTS